MESSRGTFEGIPQGIVDESVLARAVPADNAVPEFIQAFEQDRIEADRQRNFFLCRIRHLYPITATVVKKTLATVQPRVHTVRVVTI